MKQGRVSDTDKHTYIAFDMFYKYTVVHALNAVFFALIGMIMGTIAGSS